MKMTVHHLTARLIDGGLSSDDAQNIAKHAFDRLAGTFGEPMLRRLMERVTEAKRTALLSAEQAKKDHDFAAMLDRIAYEIQDELLASEAVTA